LSTPCPAKAGRNGSRSHAARLGSGRAPIADSSVCRREVPHPEPGRKTRDSVRDSNGRPSRLARCGAFLREVEGVRMPEMAPRLPEIVVPRAPSSVMPCRACPPLGSATTGCVTICPLLRPASSATAGWEALRNCPPTSVASGARERTDEYCQQ
jgi:hypothetical protein